MTTSTVTSAATHTSDATFRTWAQQVHDLIAAVGLVQTDDTGQIDIASATKPSGTGDAGYEVWRFDDDLQATAPIFIKIYYGASGTTSPRVHWEVGTASDGAGTLADAVTLPTPTGSTTDTSSTWAASHSNGFFGIRLFAGSNVRQSLAVERLRDTDGAPSARGIYVRFSYMTTNMQWGIYRKSTGSWATSQVDQIFWPGGSSGVYGDSVFVGTSTPGSGDNTHGALEKTIGVVAVGQSDYPEGSTLTVTRWDGDSHTYRTIGPPGNGPTSSLIGFLWE